MIEPIEYTTAEYPTVTYNREPIPVAVLDGVPWWSTAHIQSLVFGRYNPNACNGFTVDHVGAHRFPFDGEGELSHVITGEAAFWLLDAYPRKREYRMAAGWLRKREKDLRTADLSEAPLLSLGGDGKMPPQPDWSQEVRKAAWVRSLQLQSPDEYAAYLDQEAEHAARRERNRLEEAARMTALYPSTVTTSKISQG